MERSNDFLFRVPDRDRDEFEQQLDGLVGRGVHHWWGDPDHDNVVFARFAIAHTAAEARARFPQVEAARPVHPNDHIEDADALQHDFGTTESDGDVDPWMDAPLDAPMDEMEDTGEDRQWDAIIDDPMFMMPQELDARDRLAQEDPEFYERVYMDPDYRAPAPRSPVGKRYIWDR